VALGGGFGIDYHLDNAITVTKVNKYQAAMVPTSVNPTSQRYFGAGMLFV
jgi:hypothetical protein